MKEVIKFFGVKNKTKDVISSKLSSGWAVTSIKHTKGTKKNSRSYSIVVVESEKQRLEITTTE